MDNLLVTNKVENQQPVEQQRGKITQQNTRPHTHTHKHTDLVCMVGFITQTSLAPQPPPPQKHQNKTWLKYPDHEQLKFLAKHKTHPYSCRRSLAESRAPPSQATCSKPLLRAVTASNRAPWSSTKRRNTSTCCDRTWRVSKVTFFYHWLQHEIIGAFT